MKKLILLLTLGITNSLYAQEKVDQYCELLAIGKILSNKVSIDVDFGEERKFIAFKNQNIKDEVGKVKTFNSVVGALNYMGSLGWKYVDSYSLSDPAGTGKVLHFLFKKEFLKEEIIAENIDKPTKK